MPDWPIFTALDLEVLARRRHLGALLDHESINRKGRPQIKIWSISESKKPSRGCGDRGSGLRGRQPPCLGGKFRRPKLALCEADFSIVGRRIAQSPRHGRCAFYNREGEASQHGFTALQTAENLIVLIVACLSECLPFLIALKVAPTGRRSFYGANLLGNFWLGATGLCARDRRLYPLQ